MFLWELHIFTLRLRASGKIEDTRRYMKYLYLYWYHKGYWGAITSSLVDFLNMFIVFAVALIFTVCFHWEAARECVDAQCSETSMTGGVALPHLFHRTVLGYTAGIIFFVTSLVACVYECVKFLQTLFVEYEIEEIVRCCGINTGYLTLLHKWRHRWRERQLRCRCDAYQCNRRECVTLRTSSEPLLTTMGWGEFVEMMCETNQEARKVNDHPHYYHHEHDTIDTNTVNRAVERIIICGDGSNINNNNSNGSEFISTRAHERDRLNASWNSSLSSSLPRASNAHSCHGTNDAPLDVLHAIQGLLHTENYLIALHESGILDQHALQHVREQTLKALLSVMFDPFHTLLPFHQCLWALRAKVVQLCVLHLCLYPFIATYTVMKMLVKHAAQFKANYRDFSRREWNPRARWTFRLYNEVHHLHACRLVNGNEVAREMVERLAVSNSLSRFMRRLSSTVVLICVVLSFINPSLLIHGYLMKLSVVWWLTVALVVYATFSDEDPREREYVYHTDLERLSDAIHFTEPVWFDSGEAFLESITTRYLRSRLYLITHDLCQTLLLPYTLMCLLTDGSLELLAQTVEDVSVFEEGVGSVAEGAVFHEGVSSVLFNHTMSSTKNGRSADRHVTGANLNTNEMTLLHEMTKAKRKRTLEHDAKNYYNDISTIAAPANIFIDKGLNQLGDTDKLGDTTVGHVKLHEAHNQNGFAHPQIKLDEQVEELPEELSTGNARAKMLRRKYSIASFAAVYPHWTQRQISAQLELEHHTVNDSDILQGGNVIGSDADANDSMIDRRECSDLFSGVDENNAQSDNTSNNDYNELRKQEEEKQLEQVSSGNKVCDNSRNGHSRKRRKEFFKNNLHSSHQQQHTHKESTLHVPLPSPLTRDGGECVKEAVNVTERKMIDKNTFDVDQTESHSTRDSKALKAENESANYINSPNVNDTNVMHKHQKERSILTDTREPFHSQIKRKNTIHDTLSTHDNQSNSTDSESNYETDSQEGFVNTDNSDDSRLEIMSHRVHKYDTHCREKCAARSSHVHLSHHSLDPQRSTAHEREQLFVSQVRSMMQLQRQQPKSKLTSYGANKQTSKNLH